MSRFRRSIVPLFFVLVLAGCAVTNPQVRTTTGPDAALIFGFFDVTDGPGWLESVTLAQNERAGIAFRESSMTTFEDGLFFMENIPPMGYVIPRFRTGRTLYSLGQTADDMIMVPAGGMVFVGAFKYKPAGGGFLTTEKFEMEPTASPSEAEILQMMLSRLEDARWKSRIQQRLAQLD